MNAVRILVWLSHVGGILDRRRLCAKADSRLAFWAVALAIEYLSPAARFWIPKYGASSIEDWAVEGGHMAERCAGFIIIALGESIVVTGATFADLAWTTETVGAFVSAFVGAHRDVVDLFPQGRRSRLRADFKIERTGAAGEAGLYLPASCRSSPASFSRRSPMNWC